MGDSPTYMYNKHCHSDYIEYVHLLTSAVLGGGVYEELLVVSTLHCPLLIWNRRQQALRLQGEDHGVGWWVTCDHVHLMSGHVMYIYQDLLPLYE